MGEFCSEKLGQRQLPVLSKLGKSQVNLPCFISLHFLFKNTIQMSNFTFAKTLLKSGSISVSLYRYEKKSPIKIFYELLPPSLMIDWHLANQPIKITFVTSPSLFVLSCAPRNESRAWSQVIKDRHPFICRTLNVPNFLLTCIKFVLTTGFFVRIVWRPSACSRKRLIQTC